MCENEPILLPSPSHVPICADWLCELGKPLTTLNSALPSRRRGSDVRATGGACSEAGLAREREGGFPAISLPFSLLLEF